MLSIGLVSEHLRLFQLGEEWAQGRADLRAAMSRVHSESNEPTPYAVDCTDCGLVYMTSECYNEQMDNPDALWRCPRCGQKAEWNDAVYEESLA